jgi:hypothetical protein
MVSHSTLLRLVFISIAHLLTGANLYVLGEEPRKNEEVQLFQEASRLLSQGKFREAIVAFDRVIKSNPRSAIAHRERGRAKAGNMDFAGAIEDFTRAVELNPDDASAWLFRGNLHESLAWPVESESFPDAKGRALMDYNEALKRRPEFASGLIARGCYSLHYRMRDHGAADFKKALEVAASPAERKEIAFRLEHRVLARLAVCVNHMNQVAKGTPRSQVTLEALPDMTGIAILCEQVGLHNSLAWSDAQTSQSKSFRVTSATVNALTMQADKLREAPAAAKDGGKSPGVDVAERMRVRLLGDLLYQQATWLAFATCRDDSLDSLAALNASLRYLEKKSGDASFRFAADAVKDATDDLLRNRNLRQQAVRILLETELKLTENWIGQLRQPSDAWRYPGFETVEPIRRIAFLEWLQNRREQLLNESNEEAFDLLQASAHLVSAMELHSLLRDNENADAQLTERIVQARRRISGKTP